MKNINDYINILKSYQRIIERDNGEHPSAVLSDISASLKFVLAGTETPTAENKPANSPMSVDKQEFYMEVLCRANDGQRDILRSFIDNCEAGSMDYNDLILFTTYSNRDDIIAAYWDLDTACRDKIIDYAQRIFD